MQTSSFSSPAKHTPSRGERGMTLIELLVALVIGAILVTLIFQFFSSQSTSLTRGRESAEMQQELRWAMQFISEHVRLAGNNAPQVLLDESGSQVIENGNGSGSAPDSLSIVGSFKSVVITLDQTMGNEGSQIKCSDKANAPAIPLTDLFSTGDIVFISDGTFSEIFAITSISGEHLYHAAYPPWNDDNKLAHRYAVGSTLTMITTYSFYIETDADGHPNLMVSSLVYPPQILAGDVEQFQIRFGMRNGTWQDTVTTDEITQNEVSQVEIYLRARSHDPIPGYTDVKYGDAYRHLDLKTVIIPKNITAM